MTKNMTAGSPAKLILLFMIPLLIGNLFQQFYNMADTFIVGRTLGAHALAAVGCTGGMTFLILGFAGGATSGLAIVTSQRFGAEDHEGVRRSFAVGIVLSAIIAVVLTAASVALTRPFLTLLRTPAEIYDDAFSYIVIIFAGIPATMLFNLLSNILRAVGDSRTPLYFLVAACLLNIALDYGLILLFDMGVAGAAVATILAQGVSGTLCILYIWRRFPLLRLRRRDFRFGRAELWDHARIGLPMGFQSSIIAIGALVLQFALNGLGADAVAAFTAAQKIENVSVLPLMSFGVTMATYTAQNYGAGKIRRISRGVFQCTLMSLSFSVFMGAANVLFGERMAAFFLGSDGGIAATAHTYLIIIGVSLPFLSLLFIFRNTLQGLGQSLVPTIAGIMELIMRAIAGLVLTYLWGFAGASLSSPMAWLGACIPLTIAYVRTIRHLQSSIPDQTDSTEASTEPQGVCDHPQ